MDVVGILDRLKGDGITVTINEDRIRLRPASRVSPEVAETVREHKSDQYLNSYGTRAMGALCPSPKAIQDSLGPK